MPRTLGRQQPVGACLAHREIDAVEQGAAEHHRWQQRLRCTFEGAGAHGESVAPVPAEHQAPAPAIAGGMGQSTDATYRSWTARSSAPIAIWTRSIAASSATGAAVG